MCRPGLPVDEEFICRQLLRRAPQDPLSTARHEPDQVEVLSGVYQGVTTGMPVCLLLRNRDVRSADYDALRHTPRPSHADYTAWVQSGGRNDPRGGGAFSGRLTAPLVAAGALAKSWLKLQDIKVNAQVIDENALRQRAEEARQEGDSVGGQVRCIVTGLPAGWGGPDWRETAESEIARHVFAIPGVKAVAFGAGEELAALRGSQANDPWRTGRPEGLVCHQSQPRASTGGHHQRDAGGVRGMHPAHPLHRPASADGGSGPAKRRGADHHRPARPLYPASGAARDRGRRRPGCLPADGLMTDLDRERDAI